MIKDRKRIRVYGNEGGLYNGGWRDKSRNEKWDYTRLGTKWIHLMYPFCAQSGKAPKHHGGELMLHDARTSHEACKADTQ